MAEKKNAPADNKFDHRMKAELPQVCVKTLKNTN